MDSNEAVINTEFLKTLRVLYVEDEEEIRTMLATFLARRFAQVDVAENGKVGLEMFEKNSYDIVITDVKMPFMDGLEMAKQIKKLKEDMPVIVVTAFSEVDYLLKAIDIGVNSYVKKPIETNLLLEAISKSTRLHFQELEVRRARQITLDILIQTVEAMARAIEKRDPYTDGHQKRVSALGVLIATQMGLSADSITAIRLGGLIHDVGKLSIPLEILSMPRKLNEMEFSFIKSHPKSGFEILDGISFPWPITQIILQHHEHIDGSGYPSGLKGDEISIEARIVSVADVVEAISSHRPYRPALGVEMAKDELIQRSGTFYDKNVVDACLKIIEVKGDKIWKDI